VQEVVSRFEAAYAARDVDTIVDLFAENGDVRMAPGTFTGKAAIRRVFEWDVRVSPRTSSRKSGVGMIVHGNVAVSECVLEQAYEGIPCTFPAVTVFELNEAGKIEHVRAYYEKLSIIQQVASRYPGLKGWFFRRIVSLVAGQVDKGLERR
jgi:hypothetical protein